MFKPGDIVIVKKADEIWAHMIGKMGIFICHDETENEILTDIIRPFHSELKLKFATRDLELVCRGQDISAIWEEEGLDENR